MKTFNELKKGDKIKVGDYIIKVGNYNEEYKAFHCEGRKLNDYATYLTFLISEENYNSIENKWDKLHFTPFNKDCEVISR